MGHDVTVPNSSLLYFFMSYPRDQAWQQKSKFTRIYHLLHFFRGEIHHRRDQKSHGTHQANRPQVHRRKIPCKQLATKSTRKSAHPTKKEPAALKSVEDEPIKNSDDTITGTAPDDVDGKDGGGWSWRRKRRWRREFRR
jgi:hypothetical protein